MEVRFVGFQRCSHCHQIVALLQPCAAGGGPLGEAIALGVRVEAAVGALLEDFEGGLPSLVEYFLDRCHERGEVPLRIGFESEARGVVVGLVYLQGPDGVTAVRCTPGEGVLIAAALRLPCVIDDDYLRDRTRDEFHRIRVVSRGNDPLLH